MANEVQTSDTEKARVEAAVLQQFGLRWAILGAWRDALRLRNVSLPGDVDPLLESARTKIASGCFSVCSVGCDLSQIEGALTTADSSTTHNWVDFWIDLLGQAMSNSPAIERILKVPAVKARYQNCGVIACRC
jgi:hypothetical protein